MKTNRFFAIALIAMISTTTFANNAVISLSKTHYQRGEDVVIYHSNGKGSELDYIGIAPLGQEITGIPGGYTSTWSYLNPPGSTSGTTTIPSGNFNNLENTPDGYYYAIYLLNDGYEYGSEKVYFYLGESLPETTAKELTVSEVNEDYTTIIFTEDVTWRELIYEVSINGVPTDDYAITEGTLYILQNLTGSSYKIVIKATNWVDTEVFIGASAVNTTEIDNMLKYANPSNGTIEIDNNNGLIQYVVVSDMQGKQIMQRNLSSSISNIDIFGLTSGVYFVNFIGDTLNKTIKIVKK